MPFDIKKFKKTRFIPRTDDVKVPDMKAYFAEGDKPVWKVRGLTGPELGRCNEMAANTKKMAAILEGVAGSSPGEIRDAVKKLIGDREDTPEDIARRMYLLITGSVEPALVTEAGDEDLDAAIQLAKAFPIEFMNITNRIVKLTGMGHLPGK